MAMTNMTNLPTLPTSQQAIVQSEKNLGSFEISTNRPIPAPLPSQVLIEVSAVALNHCDWKMPGRVPCPGAVDGADYSGTVVRLGKSAALTSGLEIGDRVTRSSNGL
jgi:NADPH:quinone reductase-like Zn-dependent oxidoreductase